MVLSLLGHVPNHLDLAGELLTQIIAELVHGQRCILGSEHIDAVLLGQLFDLTLINWFRGRLLRDCSSGMLSSRLVWATASRCTVVNWLGWRDCRTSRSSRSL